MQHGGNLSAQRFLLQPETEALYTHVWPLATRFGSEITPCHLADTRGPLLMGVANLDPIRFRTRSFRYRLYDRVIQPSLPSEQISRVIFEIR